MTDSSRTIRLKLDADAKGILKATKDAERDIDRMTKSVDKKFRKSGEDSGRAFTSGLKKWFSPRALGDLKKAGEFGGTLFGSGLLGALKTPVIGPAILAAAVAAAATAAPAAGAIVAGGVVAGFGAGLAALGITFAAKSKTVQDKWSRTLAAMGADMRLLSRPFESTLVRLADVASRTFATFKPELDKAFKAIAPALTSFGDQVGVALGQLAPAVAPLSQAFTAVLRSLGPALQSAVGNVSAGLTRLADSVKANPTGLADLVKGAGDLARTGLDLVTSLNDINGQIERLTGGVSGVDMLMGGLNGTLKAVKFGFETLLAPVTTLNKLTKPVGDGFRYTATSAQEAATASGYWTQGLSKAQLAAMGITGATKGAGTAAESLTTKYNRQKAATDALLASMFRLQNLALGLAGAQISFQAAVDDATASVKQNGRTLDINSAAGRANKQALLAVASAANQQAQSMIESSKGLGATTAAAQTARANFSALAQKMGLSKKEADRLAASLIALPPKKSTTVTTPGAKGSKSDVDALGRSLANLPKSTTINVYRRMIETTIRPDVGVRAPGRASGGPVQPNRSYLVGERGPEMLTVGAGGARVTSAERTRAELARQDQPLVIENRIEIGGEVVRVVRSELRADRRQLKRAVAAGAR